MSKKVLASLAVLCVTSAVSPALSADWSDTAISYRYGWNFREPGVTKRNGQEAEIAKNIIAFTHANGYKYGGNFFNIDVLKSNKADPANGGDTGAVEAYAIYRHDLSLNKVTGSKMFSFGPIRDVAFELGVDASTKNTAFAARKFMPVAGVAFAMDVPGLWNVAILADKEWNHNGITRRHVTFDTAVMLSTVWNIPIADVGAPMSFEGFGLINSPKGRDGFNRETKIEIQFRPKLMWDVGALLGQPKTFKVGAGWQYWYNKFGNDHNLVKGAIESSPFVEARVHF